MRGRMAKTGSRPSEAIDSCGKEKLTNEATFVHSGEASLCSHQLTSILGEASLSSHGRRCQRLTRPGSPSHGYVTPSFISKKDGKGFYHVNMEYLPCNASEIYVLAIPNDGNESRDWKLVRNGQ